MKRNANKGFTVAEVIVSTVILGTLLFLLWGMTPTECSIYLGPPARVKALNNARNIGMALKTYANEHDGEFPQGNTAAEVFSQLLPQRHGAIGYLDNKSQFYVKGSMYTLKENIEGFSSGWKVEEGENHWGVMSGLNASGSERWPLLFDGPASKDGRYSSNKSEKGGIWEGKVAIVVRLDGSSFPVPLNEYHFISEGKNDNILKPSDDWLKGGRLLMPY